MSLDNYFSRSSGFAQCKRESGAPGTLLALSVIAIMSGYRSYSTIMGTDLSSGLNQSPRLDPANHPGAATLPNRFRRVDIAKVASVQIQWGVQPLQSLLASPSRPAPAIGGKRLGGSAKRSTALRHRGCVVSHQLSNTPIASMGFWGGQDVRPTNNRSEIGFTVLDYFAPTEQTSRYVPSLVDGCR